MKFEAFSAEVSLCRHVTRAQTVADTDSHVILPVACSAPSQFASAHSRSALAFAFGLAFAPGIASVPSPMLPS